MFFAFVGGGDVGCCNIVKADGVWGADSANGICCCRNKETTGAARRKLAIGSVIVSPYLTFY